MNAAELLRELVRTPSVSGDERAAAELLATWLREAGIDTQQLDHEAVAEDGEPRFAALVGELRGSEAGNGAPVLLFCSHLDTVPAGSGWSADPWDVDWQGEELRGLGANDAKASVAAMCAAAAAAAADPALLDGIVLRIALVGCEETDNSGAAAMLAACGMPDAAVIGEPTGIAVVRSQAGLAVLTADWQGTGCHSAHAARDGGDNALLHAARDLASLPPCTRFEAGHPLLGPTTLVPAVLTAGDRHNRVPDRAHAVFDGRLTPPHDAAMLRAHLADELPKARVRIRSERLKAVDTPADHRFVRAAVQAAGVDAAVGSNTMSDMALLADVPAVKCGPGRTERSHKADEHVTRAELQAGVDFYTALLPLAAAALAIPA